MDSRRPSLQDILYVEDTRELLETRCASTGLPLWPLIRNQFLRAMLSDLLYENQIGAPRRRRPPVALAAATLARATLHDLTSTVRAPGGICIMASGMGLQKQDSLWFNRLADHFALAAPSQTCLIEDRFNWTWPFPRHFSNVLFHAPYQALGVLAGPVLARRSDRDKAAGIVALIGARARERFGWSPEEQRLTTMTRTLARRAAAVPLMYSTYRRLLASTGAKLLLKEEACYGSSAVVVAAARSLGMEIAEYQHGGIFSGHDAYNFAPAVLASDAYRRCLPDYFLGYGSWWNAQINAPVEKHVIGNPHREATVAGIRSGHQKHDILVIGDGVDTELYLQFALDLAPLTAPHGLQVVFRPHPLERALVESKTELTERIQVDTRGEIYHSLARARAVVSEASTVLFEAVGISDAVFVWDTPKSRFHLPSHPFRRVSGAGELAGMVCDDGAPEIKAEAIWAGGWRENYLGFLRDRGIAPIGGA